MAGRRILDRAGEFFGDLARAQDAPGESAARGHGARFSISDFRLTIDQATEVRPRYSVRVPAAATAMAATTAGGCFRRRGFALGRADETVAAGDQAAHRLARLWIARQGRISHALLHLEAPPRLRGIGRNRFVDVGRHAPRNVARPIRSATGNPAELNEQARVGVTPGAIHAGLARVHHRSCLPP